MSSESDSIEPNTNDRRPTSSLSTLSKRFLGIQVLLALFYSLAYINKHWFHGQYGGDLAFYYGDFYAPIFILSLFQFTRIFLESKPRNAVHISWRKALFTFFVLSIVFEYYLPQSSELQVGDGWDIVMYAMGTVFFMIFFNGEQANASQISEN
ncbi:MAG: hypothetical protein SchgKO_17230 [Schleiferiaceae bacterium]